MLQIYSLPRLEHRIVSTNITALLFFSPRTPAKCIAATKPGMIVRFLKFWF